MCVCVCSWWCLTTKVLLDMTCVSEDPRSQSWWMSASTLYAVIVLFQTDAVTTVMWWSEEITWARGEGGCKCVCMCVWERAWDRGEEVKMNGFIRRWRAAFLSQHHRNLILFSPAGGGREPNIIKWDFYLISLSPPPALIAADVLLFHYVSAEGDVS